MTKLSCSRAALGTLCVALATAAASQATIHSDRGFQGRALTLSGSDRNILNDGFDDVGSIVVHSWRSLRGGSNAAGSRSAMSRASS